VEGDERRRRGMVTVCVRADLINRPCQRTPPSALDEPDVVLCENPAEGGSPENCPVDAIGERVRLRNLRPR
jgi:hypothetical protein